MEHFSTFAPRSIEHDEAQLLRIVPIIAGRCGGRRRFRVEQQRVTGRAGRGVQRRVDERLQRGIRKHLASHQKTARQAQMQEPGAALGLVYFQRML